NRYCYSILRTANCPYQRYTHLTQSTMPTTRTAPTTLTHSPLSLLETLHSILEAHLPYHLSHYLRLLLSPLTPQIRPTTGTITLVGAGPGPVHHLTLQAYTHIRNADLVISDRLIHPSVLGIVRGKVKMLPRHERKNSDDAQEDAYKWMVEGINAGLRVVRLKGGNGFVFGRGGEEIMFLRSKGITKVEIVPGLSSCVTAAESALIPITHRGIADQFLVLTARRENGSTPSLPPYEPRRTLVIMMGIGRLPTLTEKLMSGECGFPAWVPVAVVEKGTWESQRVVRGTLETISTVVKESGIKCHAVIYVGGVVDVLREDMGGVGREGGVEFTNVADEGVDVGRYIQ
ncbi:hypothetical protein HK097_004850, partial [Rhizophlyctis rosea]